MEAKLVFQKVESLTTIECKLLVAGKKREVLGDGVGNDDVVAGVMVVLSLVECKAGIGVSRIATQGQELYAVVLLYRGEHLLSRLPML